MHAVVPVGAAARIRRDLREYTFEGVVWGVSIQDVGSGGGPDVRQCKEKNEWLAANPICTTSCYGNLGNYHLKGREETQLGKTVE